MFTHKNCTYHSGDRPFKTQTSLCKHTTSPELLQGRNKYQAICFTGKLHTHLYRTNAQLYFDAVHLFFLADDISKYLLPFSNKSKLIKYFYKYHFLEKRQFAIFQTLTSGKYSKMYSADFTWYSSETYSHWQLRQSV